MNNEEAGPGACRLDKQMSGGFQRCSGDLVGSGVTTQPSTRLNTEHTFLHFKLIICCRRPAEENTDGNIKMPFHSLIILRCVVLAGSVCPCFASARPAVSSPLPLSLHYSVNIFPLQPKATDLIIQLCKYFKISLVGFQCFIRLVNSQVMIPHWAQFPSRLIAAVGNGHKPPTRLPERSCREISNS